MVPQPRFFNDLFPKWYYQKVYATAPKLIFGNFDACSTKHSVIVSNKIFIR